MTRYPALPDELVERLREVFPELPRYIVSLRLDIRTRDCEPTIEVTFLPVLTEADGAEIPPGPPQTRTFRIVSEEGSA